MAKTLEHGWSRVILTHQIESGIWEREGKAITNFQTTLPPRQSDLAQQTLKDLYLFDFLELIDKHSERELELALTQHITEFLLGLGVGFAYVSRQVPLNLSQ